MSDIIIYADPSTSMYYFTVGGIVNGPFQSYLEASATASQFGTPVKSNTVLALEAANANPAVPAGSGTQQPDTPAIVKAEELYKPKVIGDAPTVSSSGNNKQQDDNPSSDLGTVEVTATREEKQQVFNRTYNPLGKFSSYTYKISLYMMSSDAVDEQNISGIWNTKQMQLVAQSAGVNKEVDSPRATGFGFDYYIDNLTIRTLAAPGETGFSGVQNQITFDIFEPYGMTFPTRLLTAAAVMDQSNTGGGGQASAHLGSAMSQFYLLVVRFFGYDANGNVVTAPPAATGTLNKTNDLGLFERAYPLVITNMATKLDNKVVRYSISATAINEREGLSQFTGTIQEQATLSGDTVESLLATGENSLVSILNKKEADLVKAKKKEVADVYEIIFEDSSDIRDAMLVDANHYSPEQTPMTNSSNVRSSESGKAATVSKQKRSVQINPGTRITLAIEQVISQSSYVNNSLSVSNKEETQPVQENDPVTVKNASPTKFSWFTITTKTQRLEKDEKLNSHGYKVTYFIQKYSMPFVRSPYIENKSAYPGPSKIYKYWYAGKNEGVMSLDINYNNLYSSIASLFGGGTVENKDNLPMRLTSSSGGDSQGKPAGTGEEIAGFKTWLYSGSEQINARMKILGDPDFLTTASFGPFNEMTQVNISEEAPINALPGQVFIEVDIRAAVDYEDKNGLLKVQNNLIFNNFSEEVEAKTQGRMVFVVNTILSKFSRGMFTQEFLNLSMPDFGSSTPASDTNANQREGSAAPATNNTQSAVRAIDNNSPSTKAPMSTEDDNGYVSNNNTAKNEEADQRQAFVGYRTPRRTNKQNRIAGE